MQKKYWGKILIITKELYIYTIGIYGACPIESKNSNILLKNDFLLLIYMLFGIFNFQSNFYLYVFANILNRSPTLVT